ncbi:MAG: NlpC/P60 family protein [Candidatus Aminicenantes bacterium]|nr:NlpC/P60 family protein [Candidatus Aminicenantes bacterium]
MKNRPSLTVAALFSLVPVLGLLLLATAAPACRSRTWIVPLGPAESSGFRDFAGYKIQVGVFSLENNAVRLTLSLRQRGLNAFSFFHETRVFKVQIGPYSTREEAVRAAEDLAGRNIIAEYLIIRPWAEIVPGRKSGSDAALRDRLASTALGYVEFPYVWGGALPEEGFDCSGLAMTVYRMNGIPLPRALAEQYEKGKRVPPGRMKKGDLVFFSMEKTGRVSHVGILIDGDRFIHAPGRNKTIRPDSLSNPYYRDRILGVRSYF